MATTTTEAENNLDVLKRIIVDRKGEVTNQFNMLRTNLAIKERALCTQLDEIYAAAVNNAKGVLRSIVQLEVSTTTLENTLKENHVLNLLEKTICDLNVEKQRLVEESETTKNVQLVWNLEPFVNDLNELCAISTTTATANLIKKSIKLIRNPMESFGFVIMSDASEQVSICRINTGTPAHYSELKVGDIVLELNGEDITNCTHFDVVEKIRNLTRVTLSIKRISE